MIRYRILSLDGGGIRGLLTLVLLQKLDKLVEGWLSRADLIAGTSTGGIIALALAHGLPPAEVRKLYEDKCGDIFDDSWLDDLLDVGNLMGAAYDNKGLRWEVKRILGKTKLKDLAKKVLISTFDLDNEAEEPNPRHWKAKYFHNFSGEDSDGEALAYKVALYTSAAPSYFPAVDGYIDGGVVTNNPSMAALAQTQDLRAIIENRPALNEIALLSIGTGQPLYRIEGKRNDWGWGQWARPIIDVMMDGGMRVVDYQCQQLMREHYHRVSPIMSPPVALDACHKKAALIELGETTPLEKTVQWLQEYWM
jgi:patatin-like phospholipase/acyl hydrolase